MIHLVRIKEAGAIIANISIAITVLVGLVGILDVPTIVAGIADLVAVGVMLVGIIGKGAVIDWVLKLVTIQICRMITYQESGGDYGVGITDSVLGDQTQIADRSGGGRGDP